MNSRQVSNVLSALPDKPDDLTNTAVGWLVWWT